MKNLLSIILMLFCLNSFGQAQFDAVYVSNNSVDSVLSGGVKIWEKPEYSCEGVYFEGVCYDTVTIGNYTWMTSNFYYDDGNSGIFSYNDEPDSSAIYGYMYTHEASLRVADSIEGWHRATSYEWEDLKTAVSNSSGPLKETGFLHWSAPNTGATNSTGFTALPGGYCWSSGTNFSGINIHGYFWADTSIISPSYGYIYTMDYNTTVISGPTYSGNAYSLRLVMDTSICASGQVEIMGECYDTVQIGTQTWLARNIHYDDLAGGIYSYNDDTAISDDYGYLYNWSAASRIDASIDGWHLPTNTELTTLKAYLDPTSGSALAGGYDLWQDGLLRLNGSFGSTGWNAIPGGYRFNSSYFNINANALFWGESVSSTNAAYYQMVYNSAAMAISDYSKTADFCNSVRLIKD